MKRLVLDVDVGSDDAVALLLLLHAEKIGLVKLEAICCSRGNASLEDVSKNVIRILQLIGRTDIPVYRGSQHELIRFETDYCTGDGFGNLTYDTEPDTSLIRDVPSAIAMYEIAARYTDEIHLVCLGPLTNVAMAMRLYSDFGSLLREIYIMGGNFKGVGNAEYNFYVDPEAAHIVLESAPCQITIVPWETCVQTKIPFEWRFNEMGDVNDSFIQLLNKAEKRLYDLEKRRYWHPCDAFLALALVHPEAISKEEHFHATVELGGRETRGQMVLDHHRKRKPNVRIIVEIKDEVAKDVLFKASRSGIGPIC